MKRIEELTNKQQVHIKNNKQLRQFCKTIKFDFVSTKAPCYYTQNEHGRGFSTEAHTRLETIPASKFLKPSLKKRVKELEKWRDTISQVKEDPNATNIEVHFDEVEKLPEKWCVKRNADNSKTINMWAGVQWGAEYYFDEYGYLHNDSNIYDAVCHGYTEISFETFMKFVYKQDEKPVELEVGKWYKDKHQSKFIVFLTAVHRERGYGIDSGEWFDEMAVEADLVPATDEEVKEALIKEAERRGFKEGVRFISPGGTDYGYRLEENARITYDLSRDTLLWTPLGDIDGTGKHLYGNGKWAEIISEAIDLSKAGQLVKSNDGTVILYTTDEPPKDEYHFSGTVVESETYTKGHTCNNWLINMFTLCTEPVTLSN